MNLLSKGSVKKPTNPQMGVSLNGGSGTPKIPQNDHF